MMNEIAQQSALSPSNNLLNQSCKNLSDNQIKTFLSQLLITDGWQHILAEQEKRDPENLDKFYKYFKHQDSEFKSFLYFASIKTHMDNLCGNPFLVKGAVKNLWEIIWTFPDAVDLRTDNVEKYLLKPYYTEETAKREKMKLLSYVELEARLYQPGNFYIQYESYDGWVGSQSQSVGSRGLYGVKFGPFFMLHTASGKMSFEFSHYYIDLATNRLVHLFSINAERYDDLAVFLFQAVIYRLMQFSSGTMCFSNIHGTYKLRKSLDISGYYELVVEFRKLLLSYAKEEKLCDLQNLMVYARRFRFSEAKLAAVYKYGENGYQPHFNNYIPKELFLDDDYKQAFSMLRGAINSAERLVTELWWLFLSRGGHFIQSEITNILCQYFANKSFKKADQATALINELKKTTVKSNIADCHISQIIPESLLPPTVMGAWQVYETVLKYNAPPELKIAHEDKRITNYVYACIPSHLSRKIYDKIKTTKRADEIKGKDNRENDLIKTTLKILIEQKVIGKAEFVSNNICFDPNPPKGADFLRPIDGHIIKMPELDAMKLSQYIEASISYYPEDYYLAQFNKLLADADEYKKLVESKNEEKVLAKKEELVKKYGKVTEDKSPEVDWRQTLYVEIPLGKELAGALYNAIIEYYKKHLKIDNVFAGQHNHHSDGVPRLLNSALAILNKKFEFTKASFVRYSFSWDAKKTKLDEDNGHIIRVERREVSKLEQLLQQVLKNSHLRVFPDGYHTAKEATVNELLKKLELNQLENDRESIMKKIKEELDFCTDAPKNREASSSSDSKSTSMLSKLGSLGGLASSVGTTSPQMNSSSSSSNSSSSSLFSSSTSSVFGHLLRQYNLSKNLLNVFLPPI